MPHAKNVGAGITCTRENKFGCLDTGPAFLVPSFWLFAIFDLRFAISLVLAKTDSCTNGREATRSQIANRKSQIPHAPWHAHGGFV